MKYRMIQTNSSHFTVSKMCQTMEVSRSGYYAFLKRPESKRSKRQKQVLERIRDIHKENHEIYGAPSITVELNETGTPASKGMVARLMRKNGIRSKIKKKYKATTDSNHNLPVSENILNREFASSSRDRKWVSDITYIGTDEGWLYLAGILDLFDGAVVGWSMDSRMNKSLVINALTEACKRRNPKE
jgi:putative transposase